jgi:hypothetical protein
MYIILTNLPTDGLEGQTIVIQGVKLSSPEVSSANLHCAAVVVHKLESQICFMHLINGTQHWVVVYAAIIVKTCPFFSVGTSNVSLATECQS